MFKNLLLLILLLSLCSCSLPQAYDGPKRPPSEINTIRGYSTVCFGDLKIHDFDGRFSGYRLQSLPGPHHMTIEHRSEPFEPDDNLSLICTFISRFNVSFNTRAARTYSFDIREDPTEGTLLSVSESNNEREIDSHWIPAGVERTYFKRHCTQSSYYEECFDY